MGEQYGTSEAINVIRSGIKNGTIKTRELILTESQRCDTIAGIVFGNGRFWWIICAASSIGWSLQCPPGTILKIPDINDVMSLLA
jgi:hypothetical protein